MLSIIFKDGHGDYYVEEDVKMYFQTIADLIDGFAMLQFHEIYKSDKYTIVGKCIELNEVNQLNFNKLYSKCNKLFKNKKKFTIANPDIFELCEYLGCDMFINLTPSHLCWEFAEQGNLKLLKHAYKNGFILYSPICDIVAKSGNIDCLKFVHKHGSPLTKYTCRTSAKYGHLACLKYAHENGAVLDQETCIEAIENEHFDCLKYLYDNGCKQFLKKSE